MRAAILWRLVKLVQQPRVYLEVSHRWKERPPSEAELVRRRGEARTCQGCKLRDEEASISGVVMATLGYRRQMPRRLEAQHCLRPQAVPRTELQNPSTLDLSKPVYPAAQLLHSTLTTRHWGHQGRLIDSTLKACVLK